MKKLSTAVAAGLFGLAVCASSHARVTRIVIDETLALPASAGGPAPAIAYEQVASDAAALIAAAQASAVLR